MEAGVVAECLQLRVLRFLDVPREFDRSAGGQALPYVIRVLEGEGGHRELTMSREIPSGPHLDQDTENVALEDAGVLPLRSTAVVLQLQVERVGGTVVGRCQISRLDPRSARPSCYSLSTVPGGHPANCGIEVVVVEGHAGAPKDGPRDAERWAQGPPIAAPLTTAPGAAFELAPPPLPAPGASFELAPPPLLASPPTAPRGGLAGAPAPQALGPVTLQVLRLLDVPSRPGLGFMLRLRDDGGELCSAPPVPGTGPAGGTETVDVRAVGALRADTADPMLHVTVEYSDGCLLGNCPIYRLDPRSAAPSAYALLDARGGPANCGIELVVQEGQRSAAPGGCVSAAGAAAPSPAGGPPAASVNAASVSTLHLRILAGHDLLNKDSGLFGDVSDPYVVARVGHTERRTPTIDDNLNPVWRTGNEFAFEVGPHDAELRLEVFNENNRLRGDDSLGKAVVPLGGLPPQQWVRRRERLEGVRTGEVEFEARLMPPQLPAAPQPSAQQHPSAQAVAGAPWQPPAAGHVLPPLLPPPSRGPAAMAAPGLLGCPAPLCLPPGPPLGPGAAWPAPQQAAAPPQGLAAGPLAVPRPGPGGGAGPPGYDHGHLHFPDFSSYEPQEYEGTEPWLKPPVSSMELDELFGSDRDMDLLALTAEPWRAPVVANHDPVFQENVFPDMYMQLVKEHEGEEGARAARPVDKQATALRSKEGLPELPTNQWVPKPAPRPQAALKDVSRTGAVPEPGRLPLKALMSCGEVPAARPSGPAVGASAPGDRRRDKLKAEREMVLPEEAAEIDSLRQASALCDPDPELVPAAVEAQALGALEADPHAGGERGVWLRTASEEATLERGSEAQRWLERFEAGELRVGVSCRRGLRGQRDPLPAQDNFSLTRLRGGATLYVVVDGHGPFGHLAAFRVAQSLPKFVADALLDSGFLQEDAYCAPGGLPAAAKQQLERALLHAFQQAQGELLTWASFRDVDLASSGATCVLALCVGADVQVAWLGDARAMVATVTEDCQRVDLMTHAHSTGDPQEQQRVRQRGAVLRPVPAGSGTLRIFAPGARAPGLLATRALGDFGARALGVACQPDIRKMSFARTPGLVLLGSSGLWDAAADGAGDGGSALGSLLGACGLGRQGPLRAVRHLAAEAQEQWREAAGGQCDDVTGLLLHWPRASPEAAAAAAAAACEGGDVTFGEPPPPEPPRAFASTAEYLAWRALQPDPPTGQPPQGQPLAQPQIVAAAVAARRRPQPPQPARRLKPTTREPARQAPPPDEAEELGQLHADASLGEPSAALVPASFCAQVVGRVAQLEPAGAEEGAWFRAPLIADPVLLDRASLEARLREFQGSSAARLGVRRRRLGAAPGQDNFSVTYASDDRTVYAVCDGHGPLGHVASFRVAQSLPKFILDGLDGELRRAQEQRRLAEAVVARAFDAASADLAEFAALRGLDLFGSGAAATVALRQGDQVHVAWLGDARALVATVAGADSRVDLMSAPHIPDDEAEHERLVRAGASLREDAALRGASGAAPLRVYEHPDASAPGLSISRALGDFSVSELGVSSQPDLAKTSFAAAPGLVLLGSGGAWEFLGGGEAVLEGLLREGQLARSGPLEAVSWLCGEAQELWREQGGAAAGDATALLLHWPSEGAPCAAATAALAPAAAPPAPELLAPAAPPRPPGTGGAAAPQPQRLFLQAQPPASGVAPQACGGSIQACGGSMVIRTFEPGARAVPLDPVPAAGAGAALPAVRHYEPLARR